MQKMKNNDLKINFLKKAFNLYGDLYNYDKITYINSKTKVTIECSIHGEFSQTPNVHLQKHGCPKCGALDRIYKNTKTNEKFIEDVTKVHNNVYDYSLTQYNGNTSKIKIICKKHGIFEQKACSHLSGKGCQKCTKEKKKVTYEERTNIFINKAKEIHGDLYDYSKSLYVNSSTKLIINCSIHGESLQIPYEHINSTGCAKCGVEQKALKNRDTLSDFISKAKEVHGDLYDYSKVDYKNSKTKVDIICKKHGVFSQLPCNHTLLKSGCPSCKKETIGNLRRNTLEQFINKAEEKHGKKYNYSEVNYVNNHTKVKIICPIHGLFEQKPEKHISENGCPKCGREQTNKYNKENPIGWSHKSWVEAGLKSKNFDSFKVYIIRCWNEEEEFYKIGKTYLKIKVRFTGKNIPYNYEVVKIIEGDGKYISELEIELQRKNNKSKYFPLNKFKGSCECYKNYLVE